MLRNVASQRWRVYAWDVQTGLPKTGDAANITGIITKDDGTPAATNDVNPDEIDSTGEKGFYEFNLTQAETSAAKITLSCKSTTSNIVVMACPPVVYTVAQYDSLNAIDSNGRVDVIKIAGTPQTARDIGASVLLSSGTGMGQLDFTSGIVKANVTQLLGTAWLTPATAGTPDVNTKQVGGTPQTAKDLGAINVTTLNTLSGHDPGGTLASASDASTIESAIAALHNIQASDVWSYATRILTAGTNIALAKGTGVTGFNDLDAAGIRSAVGLASNDLDAQLLAIVTDTDELESTFITRSGTAQGATSSTLQLDAGASSVNDFYTHSWVRIISGTGAGQAPRVMNNYNGTTKIGDVVPVWLVTPDNTSVFKLFLSAESHIRQVENDAITSASIAASAIGASELATDAAQEIADAILDRSASGHTTNNTLGAIINDVEDGGRTDALIDSIIAELANGTYGLSALKTEHDTTQTALAVVDSNVDSILDDTGTSGVIVASLSAGAVDSIHDDAIAEPSGMFAWSSATPRKIMATLGVMMRNEINSDADSVDVRNDADNANLWSYASSDDGTTYISGEAA